MHDHRSRRPILARFGPPLLASILCAAAGCSTDKTTAPEPGPAPPGTWTPELLAVATSFVDVAGTPSGEIFALDRDALFMHYDGTSWSPMLRPDADREPDAIWAFAADDVHAVGGGVHYHYDGSAWTVTEQSGVLAKALWGHDGELFAAYNGGRVYHYDGTVWTEMETPFATSEHLEAIHGRALDDVWVAGRYGLLGHWDGTAWSAVDVATDLRLRGVWVAGPEDVFAVGDDGVLVHNDGGSVDVTAITDKDLRAVWGTSLSGVFVAGDSTAMRFDGSDWSAVALGDRIERLWGSAGNDVVGVGREGIWRYDGSDWSRELEDVNSGALYAISGNARPYIGGYALYQLDGEELNEYPWDTNTQGIMRAFRVFAADDIWGVGYSGAAVHFDGVAWTTRDLGTDIWLTDLYGTTGDAFYIAGADGTILSVVGGVATPMPTPTTARLNAIDGAGETVFALGNDGVILRLEGGEWIDIVSPSAGSIVDILVFSETEMVAIEAGGGLLRWDGESWTRTETGVDGSLRAVWGTSSTDLVLATSNGAYAGDGTIWTKLARHTDIGLYAIWGSAAGDEVIVVGSPRIIMRYRR